jgi:Na+/pantothenate symporter
MILAALLASIMSMIDGLLLAAAYALVCDLIHRRESLEQIDSNEGRANRLLAFIRLFIGVIALVGSIGVFALVDGLKISLFDIVYVLIICQLSLTGPVLAGLWHRLPVGDRMVWAIVTGLLVGFGAFWSSRVTAQEWLLTGAGFFAMFASIAVAFLITRSNRVLQV